jgi:hypothetical protein
VRATAAIREPAPRVGLLSAGFLAGVFALMLLAGGLAPIDLLVAGRAGPSASVITEDFGPPTNPRPGYDGQQVYAIARALPDLEQAEGDLDAPAYRSLRILHPLLAAPFPSGPAMVVALLGWSIVGVGLAAGAIADLAARHGRDPRIGFAAVPALFLPLMLSTDESLAFGLAFVAVALLDRGRMWGAATVGVLAVLAKEAALLALVMSAAGAAPTHRWRVLPVVAVPTAALGLWYVVVHRLLPGGQPGRFEVLGLLQLSPGAAVVALLVIASGVAGAWFWRDVGVLWPVSLAFGLWPLVFRPDVLDSLALPRVVAPALVLGLSGLAGELLRPRHPTSAARVTR